MHVHCAWSIFHDSKGEAPDLRTYLPEDASDITGRDEDWWHAFAWMSTALSARPSDPDSSGRELWQSESPFRVALYAAAADNILGENAPRNSYVVGAASVKPDTNFDLVRRVAEDYQLIGARVLLNIEALSEIGTLLAVRWEDSQHLLEHVDTLNEGDRLFAEGSSPDEDRILGATLQVSNGCVVNAFREPDALRPAQFYVLDGDMQGLIEAVREVTLGTWRLA